MSHVTCGVSVSACEGHVTCHMWAERVSMSGTCHMWHVGWACQHVRDMSHVTCGVGVSVTVWLRYRHMSHYARTYPASPSTFALLFSHKIVQQWQQEGGWRERLVHTYHSQGKLVKMACTGAYKSGLLVFISWCESHWENWYHSWQATMPYYNSTPQVWG